MRLKTNCDMGSIKIFSDTMSAFFENGIGDCPTTVDIVTRKSVKQRDGSKTQFLGHFTVKKPNSVFLSAYDCGNEAIHTFGVGRWFVYLVGSAKLRIEYVDAETHS